MGVLDGLNEQQRAAAAALDGPILILAGAGSGKTRTITHRVAHLIAEQDVAPDQLLVVTFTNRAARELRERLDGLLGDDAAGRVWAMTFHALCLRMLRRSAALIGLSSDFTVLDVADAKKLLAQAAEELEDPAKDSSDELNKIRSIISRAKNAGQGPEALSGELGVRAARLWRRYAELAREIEGVDFDDLLLLAVQLLRTEGGQRAWGSRFRYLMVDEYQDVNGIQEQLLGGLAGRGNLCVVGDENQCLPAETLITLADGRTRYLDLIRPGDQVLAVGAGGQPEPARVTEVTRRYAQRLVEVTLANGQRLSSTPEHVHFAAAPPPAAARPARSRGSTAVLTPPATQPLTAQLVLGGGSAPDAPHRLQLSGLNAEQRQLLGRSCPPPAAGWKGSLEWCAADVGALQQLIEQLHHLLPTLTLRAQLAAAPETLLDCLPASELQAGMSMLTTSGLQEVAQVEAQETGAAVYDLNVERLHNFFANGICTHNSVYAFRGAQVEHILRFQERWPAAQVFKLENNYRSSARILRAAQAVIDRAAQKTDKRLVATGSEGEPVRLLRFANHWDEAAFVADRIAQLRAGGVALEQIAVAYRTNAQSQALEEALGRKRLPYHVIGGVSFARRVEVQGARAYLAALANRRDRLALERAAGWPRRGVGRATVAALAERPERDLLAALEALASTPSKGVNAKAQAGLLELADVLRGAERLLPSASLAEVLRYLLDAAGINTLLRRSGERGRDQLANLDGLVELAERYPGPAAANLRDFLADTALEEQQDAEQPDGVRLMTLHACKGLEFPYVFLTGLEEELFLRGPVDARGLDEERRLLYVGMTRAERELVLSFADQRRLWGRDLRTQPLQFLFDLPAEVVRQRARAKQTGSGPPAPRRATRASGGPRRAAQPSRERVRPPEPPQADRAVRAADFAPGQQVEHPKFGAGVVVSQDGNAVQVRFADGVRRLTLEYARLKRS